MLYPSNSCFSPMNRSMSTLILTNDWIIICFYQQRGLPSFHRRFRLREVTPHEPRAGRSNDGPAVLDLSCGDVGQYQFCSKRAQGIYETITALISQQKAEQEVRSRYSDLDQIIRTELAEMDSSATSTTAATPDTSNNHTSTGNGSLPSHPLPPRACSMPEHSSLAPPGAHTWITYDGVTLNRPVTGPPDDGGYIDRSYTDMGSSKGSELRLKAPEAHVFKDTNQSPEYVQEDPDSNLKSFGQDHDIHIQDSNLKSLAPDRDVHIQDLSGLPSLHNERFFSDFHIANEPLISDYSLPPTACRPARPRSGSLDGLLLASREPQEHVDISSLIYCGLYSNCQASYDLNFVASHLRSMDQEDITSIFEEIQKAVKEEEEKTKPEPAPVLAAPRAHRVFLTDRETAPGALVSPSDNTDIVDTLHQRKAGTLPAGMGTLPAGMGTLPAGCTVPSTIEAFSENADKKMEKRRTPVFFSRSISHRKSWSGEVSWQYEVGSPFMEEVKRKKRKANTLNCKDGKVRPVSGYWTASGVSQLCRTLNKVLRDDPPHPDTLKLPRAMRQELCVRLLAVDSPLGGRSDWRALAEQVGLTFDAVNIIQAFIQQHSQKHLAAEIVLRHWQFMHNSHSSKCPEPCTIHSLVRILHTIGRNDLLQDLFHNAEYSNSSSQDQAATGEYSSSQDQAPTMQSSCRGFSWLEQDSQVSTEFKQVWDMKTSNETDSVSETLLKAVAGHETASVHGGKKSGQAAVGPDHVPQQPLMVHMQEVGDGKNTRSFGGGPVQDVNGTGTKLTQEPPTVNLTQEPPNVELNGMNFKAARSTKPETLDRQTSVERNTAVHREVQPAARDSQAAAIDAQPDQPAGRLRNADHETAGWLRNAPHGPQPSDGLVNTRRILMEEGWPHGFRLSLSRTPEEHTVELWPPTPGPPFTPNPAASNASSPTKILVAGKNAGKTNYGFEFPDTPEELPDRTSHMKSDQDERSAVSSTKL